MPRGRKPTPKAKLQARGSRHAKGRPDDLTLEAKAPKPPTTLSREARAEWNRIVAELEPRGVLAEVDRAALTLLCELWAEDRTLRAELAKRSIGTVEWRRIHHARQAVRAQLNTMIGKFGLTPIDRPRVKELGPAAAKPSGNDRFFKGGLKPRLVGGED